YVPRSFDYRIHLGVRMGMRTHPDTARNLDAIDERSRLTRIPDELCTLPPVGVVRRREPLHLFRRQRDDFSRSVIRRQDRHLRHGADSDGHGNRYDVAPCWTNPHRLPPPACLIVIILRSPWTNYGLRLLNACA